ncbi:MAG: hypothetical protein ABIQ65_03065, partial [Thermoanaerobaculia bacterium]
MTRKIDVLDDDDATGTQRAKDARQNLSAVGEIGEEKPGVDQVVRGGLLQHAHVPLTQLDVRTRGQLGAAGRELGLVDIESDRAAREPDAPAQFAGDVSRAAAEIQTGRPFAESGAIEQITRRRG